MARYIGPKCKLSRREGVDLQLKSNARSLDSKCKADTPPGMHGQRASRTTDYSIQLRMKQLIKRYYGVLERQFHNYYKKAERLKGSTSDNLIRLLESRLDNIIYRLGLAATRAEARQLVNHKAVMVNDKLVNVPSYLLAPGDIITLKEKGAKQGRVVAMLNTIESRVIPEWLSMDAKNISGVFKRYPDTSEIPPEFKVYLVVELYSK